MAAPRKLELDYYPHRTDFRHDTRFYKLRRVWGNQAMGLYQVILDVIYSGKGYYISIANGGRDNLVELLWSEYGMYDGTDYEDIDKMLDQMVDAGLFDREMFEKGILTSKEIQEVYYTATAKRRGMCLEADKWILTRERMEELGKKTAVYNYLYLRQDEVNNSQTKPNKTKPDKTIQEETKPDKTTPEKTNLPSVDTPPKKSAPPQEEEPPSVEGGGWESQIKDLCYLHFGSDGHWDMDRIRSWDKSMDIKVINHVLKYTAGQGKGFNYANAIINRLMREGTLTWEAYEKRELHVSAPGKAVIKNTAFVNYNQPVYTDEEVEAAIQRKKKQRQEERRREEEALLQRADT